MPRRKESGYEVECHSPFELGTRNIDWLHEMWMMSYGGNWKAKKMLNLKLKNHENTTQKMQSPASSTICGTHGARRNVKSCSEVTTCTFGKKWNAQAENSIYGAAERFYTELSECSRTLLVERAVSLYDGKAFRKEPDDS